jgi:5'-nucleotidase
MIRSGRGRTQFFAILAALVIALGVITVPQAAASELCFKQPGVSACVAPEFRSFWEQNGGLSVFGYPLEAAKQEQTDAGSFMVQYFERQRLELHPENAAPYNVLLGRVNDEVLTREGRSWWTFPQEQQAGSGCVAFAETKHTVCGDFLAHWRSQGLDLGDPGVSFRESLALWGLPLSQPQMEQNIDGFNVMTQHFERARMELYKPASGKQQVVQTRLGAALVPLHLKILAVNDFHGQLSTGRKVAGKNVGGAAYLAAYIKQHRALAPYSLTVQAGDMVGASPPISALFQDQPTMEFQNMLGFDVGTVGNHEFDEGLPELYRLLNGGCHPTAGCWTGANFPYVNSNVINTATGKLILPAYKIINVAGARIGFVGAVLRDTPTIIVASSAVGLEFRDEADSINAAVAELHQQGVHTIVVLIHQGGVQDQTTGKLTGQIVDIVNRLDPDIDVVVSGHTHQFTNTTLNGMLITQAFSYSTAFADIDLTIDRAKRDVVAKKADIITTFNDGITPDPEVAALVKKYEDKVAPLVNRVIGTTTVALTADQNPAGESSLGNLIADSQRATMKTQFAFMNPGGIRAPIDQGPVTWGELFAVQPFANNLVKMTLTGDQIYRLLNQQWQPQRDGSLIIRFLQISGMSYTWNDARAIGDKVVEVRGGDGQPLDRSAAYTITANSFLATGGDGFLVFKEGTNSETGPVDLDASVSYIEGLPQPFSAMIEGRIVKQ